MKSLAILISFVALAFLSQSNAASLPEIVEIDDFNQRAFDIINSDIQLLTDLESQLQKKGYLNESFRAKTDLLVLKQILHQYYTGEVYTEKYEEYIRYIIDEVSHNIRRFRQILG